MTNEALVQNPSLLVFAVKDLDCDEIAVWFPVRY